MISLEQVNLLEAKVERAVEKATAYVERLVKENAALRQQGTSLQAKLESYQKRIDELEVLVVRFKEDQSLIENGILAALDRLSQFEKAFDKAMEKGRKGKSAAKEPAEQQDAPPSGEPPSANGAEIPENAEEDDIPDPLEDAPDREAPVAEDDPPPAGGELDIF